MADDLQFQINLENPIAVYVQIENQIQFAIAAGRLKPGDPLPSVREMALQLGVNSNTVTKAYRDLELRGYVVTRRGIGVRVAPKADQACRKETQGMVQDHLRDAVAECIAAGLSSQQVTQIVSHVVRNNHRPYGKK